MTQAAGWSEQGFGTALITLVEIRGGAARALGAQMAVRADGLYCGYVSGGCTEAAVACEAMRAIEKGSDRFLRIGEGSPFFDIVLPCGGGLTLAIHILRSPAELRAVIDTVAIGRHHCALAYNPGAQSLSYRSAITGTGWQDDTFMVAYRPSVQLFIAGNPHEVEMCAKLGRAMDYKVMIACENSIKSSCLDSETAVALFYHDLDRELPFLQAALESDCFYIGALGSNRTHTKRIKALHDAGYGASSFRIKAPIGLIPKARDTATLAVSVLAEIAMCHKNEVFGRSTASS
ncbi:XdhC family protein [Brucella sp. 2716]|uniref:XdhC family protein n=1 Tax=Brucella sp. 2716 TaxID=2975052 RepID=UPI00217DBF80|nr:XdhC family protein [Brucella sp. 2716]UWF60420.1 XdhC family protein [Brucella sp. 2716]